MENQQNLRTFLKWTPLLFVLLASTVLANEVKPIKVEGVLVERQDQLFRMLDARGEETLVRVTDSTEIKEDHKNFLREPRQYGLTDLRPGLRLMVKGIPTGDGTLRAEKVRFTNKARKMAVVMDSALDPANERLSKLASENEAMLGNLDDMQESLVANRKDLSRIEETANTAGETAREALSTADRAHRRIDENDRRVEKLRDRLRLINDFFVAQETTVLFAAGSAELTEKAREALDELVGKLDESSSLVEVVGFASADGGELFNRRLSQRRAETVQRYLIETHDVELRRFVSPFGYGELEPVADNDTRQGRAKNRRAEVRVLSSRGLAPDQEAEGPTGGQ